MGALSSAPSGPDEVLRRLDAQIAVRDIQRNFRPALGFVRIFPKKLN